MKGRYFLEISYKGTNYHGWQMQQNAPSLQGEFDRCLEKILGCKIISYASGRTDTGVHAYQQYLHVDMPETFDCNQFIYKINAVLPDDITVKSLIPVKDDAHARYSAYLRTYIYKIHLVKDPFLKEYSYFFPGSLDIDKMNEACKLLIGEKNFQCFSRAKTSVEHFHCHVVEAKWIANGNQLKFTISANRFLRGMVRTIVGTLIEVGKGKFQSEEISAILASQDRKRAGRAVPACGLYLSRIKYPDHIFLNF